MEFLRDRLAEANRVIDRVLSEFKRPAVMWSSGKDSQVLLYMLRARKVYCDVVFHREPFMGHKYGFAERMIREWGLRVYDWPPAAVTVQKGTRQQVAPLTPALSPLRGEGAGGSGGEEGPIEIVNHYRFGTGLCSVPKNLYEPDLKTLQGSSRDGKWLCGLQDLVRRPLGDFVYPWDVVFHGHKSSDVDPLMGAVPLTVDIQMNPAGGTALAFPLRHWSDEDVWTYTRSFDVPQQTERYDVGAGKENPDREFNPDYWACCTRCIDRDGPATVFCPKLKCEVGNVSGQVAYHQVERPAYVERLKAKG